MASEIKKLHLPSGKVLGYPAEMSEEEAVRAVRRDFPDEFPDMPGALRRGLVSSLGGRPDLYGNFLEGQGWQHDSEFLRRLGKSLQEYGNIAPEDEQTLYEGLDWSSPQALTSSAGELVGQGLGYLIEPIALSMGGVSAGSAVGGLAGSMFGPAGRAAGAAAGGFAGSLAGGAGASYGLNYGDVYQELKQKGMPPEEAAPAANRIALYMTAPDLVFPASFARQILKAPQKELKRGFIRAALRNAKRGAVLEGATEYGQEAGQSAATDWYAGHPIDWYEALLHRGPSGAVGGAGAGGIVGAVGGVTEAARGRRPPPPPPGGRRPDTGEEAPPTEGPPPGAAQPTGRGTPVDVTFRSGRTMKAELVSTRPAEGGPGVVYDFITPDGAQMSVGSGAIVSIEESQAAPQGPPAPEATPEATPPTQEAATPAPEAGPPAPEAVPSARGMTRAERELRKAFKSLEVAKRKLRSSDADERRWSESIVEGNISLADLALEDPKLRPGEYDLAERLKRAAEAVRNGPQGPVSTPPQGSAPLPESQPGDVKEGLPPSLQQEPARPAEARKGRRAAVKKPPVYPFALRQPAEEGDFGLSLSRTYSDILQKIKKSLGNEGVGVKVTPSKSRAIIPAKKIKAVLAETNKAAKALDPNTESNKINQLRDLYRAILQGRAGQFPDFEAQAARSTTAPASPVQEGEVASPTAPQAPPGGGAELPFGEPTGRDASRRLTRSSQSAELPSEETRVDVDLDADSASSQSAELPSGETTGRDRPVKKRPAAKKGKIPPPREVTPSGKPAPQTYPIEQAEEGTVDAAQAKRQRRAKTEPPVQVPYNIGDNVSVETKGRRKSITGTIDEIRKDPKSPSGISLIIKPDSGRRVKIDPGSSEVDIIRYSLGSFNKDSVRWVPDGEAEQIAIEVVNRMTGGRATLFLGGRLYGREAGFPAGNKPPMAYNMGNLIAIAMSLHKGMPIINSAFHESWHWLQMVGNINEKYRSILDAELPRLQKIAAKELGDLVRPEDIPWEEAEAYAGAAYIEWLNGIRRDRPDLSKSVERVFRWYDTMFRRIVNALKGRGFLTSEDIFKKGFKGKLSKREVPRPYPGDERSIDAALKGQKAVVGPKNPVSPHFVRVEVEHPEYGIYYDEEYGQDEVEAFETLDERWPGSIVRVMDTRPSIRYLQAQRKERFGTYVRPPKKRDMPKLSQLSKEIRDLSKRTLPRDAKDMHRYGFVFSMARNVASTKKWRSFAPTYDAVSKKHRLREMEGAEMATKFARPREQKLNASEWNRVGRALMAMRDTVTPYEGQERFSIYDPNYDEAIHLNEKETSMVRSWMEAHQHALDGWRQSVIEAEGLPSKITAEGAHVFANTLEMDPETATSAKRVRAAAEELGVIEHFRNVPYFPKVRYGDMAVAAIDPVNDEVLHFEMFYTKGLSGLGWRQRLVDIERQLRETYPDAIISQPFEPSENFFGSMALDSLGAFDTLITTMHRRDPALYEQMQPIIDQTIREAISKRGFRKHLLPTQNIPGWSEDYRRIIGDWINSASYFIARRRYDKVVREAISHIDKVKQPRLRSYAEDFEATYNSPSDEMRALRTMQTVWTLGGTVGSAAVNLSTSWLWMPALAASTANPARAARIFASSIKDTMKMLTGSKDNPWSALDLTKHPKDVGDDFVKAWKEGIIGAQQTTYLLGLTEQATGLSAPGDITAHARNAARNFTKVAMWLFSNTEQAMRASIYIAAHRMADNPRSLAYMDKKFKRDSALWKLQRENGMPLTPDNIARHAVDEYAGVFGKLNRAQFQRGANHPVLKYMAPITQFTSFQMQQVNAMYRMFRGGSHGTLAGVLGTLLLLSGWQGLPLADDARILIEKIFRTSGREVDLDYEVRKMFSNFDPFMGEVMSKGLPGVLLDVDIGQRVGFGNNPLLPFALLEPGGQMTEVLGVPGSLFIQAPQEALARYQSGQSAYDVALPLLPNFLKNPGKAWNFATEGYITRKGSRAVRPEEFSTGDIMMQATGFRPMKATKAIEEYYKSTRLSDPDIITRRGYYMKLATTIADQVRAHRSGDLERSKELREEVRGIVDEIKERNKELLRNNEIERVITIDKPYLRQLVAQQVLGYTSGIPALLESRKLGRGVVKDIYEDRLSSEGMQEIWEEIGR